MKQKVILQLDALTCPSCITKIQSAVSNQPGVETVKTLFNAGKVKAVIDGDKTNADALNQTVAGLGYTVLKTTTKDMEE